MPACAREAAVARSAPGLHQEMVRREEALEEELKAKAEAETNRWLAAMAAKEKAQAPFCQICGGECSVELLEMYDQIHHTKEMGIRYHGNTITDLIAGLSAERQGVCVGWRIYEVNGTAMPSSDGGEHVIHSRIGEIKKRDERIILTFEACA